MKTPTNMAEVFGFRVPTETYYLHRGHAWAVVEKTDLVRVGLDDFSQKILGPADGIQMPEVGKVYYQDHICMALLRHGSKASFVAPVDGMVTEINERVREKPALIHDDPYGEGWLFHMRPINLQQNLFNLCYGQDNAAWIDEETHRLLELLDTKVGYTLQDGGTIVDDVFGHFPALGWRRLVQGFFLRNLTTPSTRRGFEGWDNWDKRTWKGRQ
jgi:glycine cleavage system H lipoate-binding protein